MMFYSSSWEIFLNAEYFTTMALEIFTIAVSSSFLGDLRTEYFTTLARDHLNAAVFTTLCLEIFLKPLSIPQLYGLARESSPRSH
ncbi:hypothetical protein AVEN_269513-1 [Araneus ventricosus]|uniref:Uncharacterized protein n=1 Tax=Araneus ventricosus TaxID=182803 RepID=A0A4Y2R349_ARAVE|nr:hypothetical protein AVEN_269513-1 [Araneus ventricosus]